MRNTLSIFILLCLSQLTFAEEPLLFGFSGPLSGPTQQLGLHMRQGIELAFTEINTQGGINGRTLELLALNDQYEPIHTKANMNQLVANDGILGIIGNIGTPTAFVSIPIAKENKILFFGAYTGASHLRKRPADKVVFNFRASYQQESEKIIDAFLESDIKPTEIGFFYQNDSFGHDVIQGAKSALQSRGLMKSIGEIPQGTYTRNQTDIYSATLNILASERPIKAILIAGTYEPTAEFIRKLYSENKDIVYGIVSFVGAEDLAEHLSGIYPKIILTQITPNYNSEFTIAQKYKEAFDTQYEQQKMSYTSFEGYIIGTILGFALKQAKVLDREHILQAFNSLKDFDIGLGYTLTLSSIRHQASEKVWPTILNEDGAIVETTWGGIPKYINNSKF